MLLGQNAKRALESTNDDDDNNEASDKASNSNSTSVSQRPIAKRRRKALQSSVTVKIKAVDKGLSKEDWKEIIAVESGSGLGNADLQHQVGSLQTTVDQLASNAEHTNSLLQQLLQFHQRTAGPPHHLAHYLILENKTEASLYAD
jgi:hypothetical protein